MLSAVVVVWLAATIAFFVLQFMPGDPVDIMLGTQSTITDEQRAAVREDLGLHEPLLVRYNSFLAGVIVGDLGTSYRLRTPVTQALAEQLTPTIQLAALALAIAVIIAVVTALLARGRRARGLAGFFEVFVISSPAFWTGLLLLTVFSFNLRWFPITGGSGLSALVLPAVTLALPVSGILSQVLRHGIDRAERQPFALTARARGLTHPQLLFRHTMRHGALPVVTLGSYIAGGLLGGTVIVEQLFGRPGLGRVTLDAISFRDMPVVIGIVIFAAVVFVTINLIIDLCTPLLDPRLRGKR